MANITLVSYHNGSVPLELTGDTPAGIAESLNISVDGVEISVDGKPVQANHKLRDDDLVGMQKAKVKSGK
jgi:sulfur carrier protein ThiS|tara:strand:+ start:963 stop:1172 length:210 start_codon:yes stop_codon:yes gene_type:complete